MNCKILDIAYYLPSIKITSKELIEEFEDFNIDKIENKVGIKSRSIVSSEESVVDIAYNASIGLVDKNLDIDFIILCTQTSDYKLPTSACILQDRLGLSKSVGALDINLGCSGYVYGLGVCKGLISSGIANKILFITADTYSKIIYQKDKGNRSIFGDGATATIIEKFPLNSIKEFVFGTDGSGFDKLILKNGGSKFPQHIAPLEKVYGDNNIYTDNHLYMKGPDIFNFTIANIPNLVNETLLKNNLSLEQVDMFVFHQANKFMLDYLRKKMKISKERFFIDLEDTGNTVSSTIPIAIAKLKAKELIKKGDLVLLAGFGVGLSWGATIIEI